MSPEPSGQAPGGAGGAARDDIPPVAERPVGLVRGTRDWLPRDHVEVAALERRLLDRFARAGYRPMRTPILEFAELHERKSGAGIVAKLFEVPGAGTSAICLRPELTASIVRAYAEAAESPALPFRVSMSGPVFRFETPSPGRDREFTQVGIELLGAGGPEADAEVIWLADWSLRALGVPDASIRIGHVGLILELLGRCGLPPAATAALVDSLSEAAAEGQSVRAIESALERLAGWLKAPDETAELLQSTATAGDRGVDRLFRHLVPDVTGRREGHEIIGRLRRKWDLAHSLHEVLDRVRDQVHALAGLRGASEPTLERLVREFTALAPQSVSALRALVAMLGHHGVAPSRIELDLGFGRGIGFYTQMIFELAVPTPGGPIEVCGGGRYDGLARVLGSDRDDRGAGFAFGLERLLGVLASRSSREPSGLTAPSGFLIQSVGAGVAMAEAVDLATYLRDRVDVPIVLSNLEFQAAVEQARGLGLAQVVTVGRSIEVWNLEHGDVREVRGGELIEQMRARLSLVRGDRQ
jgi:histidyl-tRNA synthetase